MTATARSELLFSKAVQGDLSIEAETTLPTRHGQFRCIVFRHAEDWTKEHVAMVRGDVAGDDTLLRVHSECLTSEVFGSLKCDCADQLDLALESITAQGRGVLLYLRQEGRSIGLANKIRAYALQDKGADTVDANRALNLPDDARRYDAVAAMLVWLGIHSVHLMTNNPAKVEGLRALGVTVRERVPVVIEAQPFSSAYLATKRSRMRHALP
ncbi:MAG TPA: GTP cyclohydrolase II [Polyangiaceae bacterium]|jgi:GTP cyclohydrolase II|nr:GTP cyclohydrolase II [Polyangiaceae bacterium]